VLRSRDQSGDFISDWPRMAGTTDHCLTLTG
jgi:hypothetical protein